MKFHFSFILILFLNSFIQSATAQSINIDNLPYARDPIVISRGHLETHVFYDKKMSNIYIEVLHHIKKNWHSYWSNPGQFGVPTTINLESPHSDFDVIYETPSYHNFQNYISYVYQDQSRFFIKIPIKNKNGKKKNSTQPIIINGSISWFLCSDTKGCFRFPDKVIHIKTNLNKIPQTDISSLLKYVPKNIYKSNFKYSFKFNQDSTLTLNLEAPQNQNFKPPIDVFIKNASSKYAFNSIKIIKKDRGYAITLPTKNIKDKNIHLVISVKNKKDNIDKKAMIHSIAIKIPLHQEKLFSITFFLYLLYMFLGGIILNFMPCVLPIVSLKIMRLNQDTAETTSTKTQVFFFSGVLFSLISLGIFISVFKYLGHFLGWGFSVSIPLFYCFFDPLFFVVLIQSMGIINIPIYIPQILTHNSSQFFYGIIITLSSTPCLAPLLSTSIAYALTSSYTVLFSSLTAMAIGFSLPLILVERSAFIRNRIPRNIFFAILLKYFLSFLLLLTLIWLSHLLVSLSSLKILFSLYMSLLYLFFLLHTLNQYSTQSQKEVIKILKVMLGTYLISFFIFFCITIVYLSNYYLSKIKGDQDHAFSEKTITSLIKKNQPFLLDFTADWCLTCQVINNTTLKSNTVLEYFKKNNIKIIKADWTKKNNDISKIMQQLNRAGLPLIVFYNKEGQYSIMPDVLTPSILIKEIKTHD